jgi:hypothetical protein
MVSLRALRFFVILSEAKNLIILLRVNSVKQSHEIATFARRSASARRHVTMLLAMTPLLRPGKQKGRYRDRGIICRPIGQWNKKNFFQWVALESLSLSLSNKESQCQRRGWGVLNRRIKGRRRPQRRWQFKKKDQRG